MLTTRPFTAIVFANILALILLSTARTQENSKRNTRGEEVKQLMQYLEQLGSAKEQPQCFKAIRIALQDPAVRQTFLKKLNNECFVLKDICCLQLVRPLTHEFILFDFDCAPNCACLIDPQFRVDVDVANKKVVKIWTPYFKPTKPCRSIFKSERIILPTGNDRYEVTAALPLKDLWVTGSGVIFTLKTMPTGVKYFSAYDNTAQKLSLLQEVFFRKTPIRVLFEKSGNRKTREAMELRVSEPTKTVRFSVQKATIKLGSSNYHFTLNGTKNPRIEVRKGTKVTIILTSQGGTHDWRLIDDDGNELAKSKTTDPDDPDGEKAEFTANRVGRYVYYCGVGSHRRNGMEGEFVVVEE